MASAPHITLYELFEDQPSKKIEVLFSPDQLYALAEAMSYVEYMFLAEADPELKPIVVFYKKVVQGCPGLDEVFANFCAACIDIATLAGKPEWKTDPQQYSRNVCTFLAFVLFSGKRIDQGTMAPLMVLRLFERYLKYELAHWNDSIFSPDKLVQLIFAPIHFLFRKSFPPCFHKRRQAAAAAGREALERLARIYEQAKDENRIFTFEEPEDQFEKTLDLGGLKIRADKDGGIFFG